MRLFSFDVLRTFDFPDVAHIKPEAWLRERERVLAADWLLYPEYWQVNALVYAWRRRIFPSVSSYHLGHDKVEMTRAFEALVPAHTPHTLILPATPAAVEQVLDAFAFPFVAKSVRSAMGEGVFRIDDREGLLRYVRDHTVLYCRSCYRSIGICAWCGWGTGCRPRTGGRRPRGPSITTSRAEAA